MVILSSRIYGCNGERAQSLACVRQFIHLASIVHKSIPEKDTDYVREIQTRGMALSFLYWWAITYTENFSLFFIASA
jgi:hypothetical protein